MLSGLLLRIFALVALVATALPRPATAQSPVEYERRELTVPVRDGVTLTAVALIPKGAHTPLPILLVRTAFGASRHFSSAAVPVAYRELAQDGYIFVAEDIRGRNGSGGTFVTNRAQQDPRNAPGTNESTDAYDTIDWLVKHLPGNNGRVGVIGTSYSGWLAGLAAVGAHPALKAVSPQAPSTDTWLGDDFFHQGAFRQTQGVTYAALIEGTQGLPIPDFDQYAFYRRMPTLDALAKATGVAALPSWIGFREHPAYDAYWQAKAMQRVLTTATVPTLFVGGFWDEEDMLGAQLAYRTLEANDTRGINRLVLGPWAHNTWTRAGGDVLGPVPLGANTADDFREKIQRPWFAHYLHGVGDGRFPEAWVFESGGNRWRTFETWPSSEVQSRNIYLREHGMISFDPPPANPNLSASTRTTRGPMHTPEYDAYVADPEHPVPYMPRPDNGSAWDTWMQQDQRFVEGRPDVLTWISAPLTSDVTIGGTVVAHLFASTTGTDADGVVKLIDVAPDTVQEGPITGGYELIVNADILRGRYWRGFGVAHAIPANKVTPFHVDLHDQLYRFKRGHRLMVQVQSTWFPLYDRNPQTFVPNIFLATSSDYRAQTHRVWHTARYPSHITLPVLR
ncbi:MAG: CocE/NonD family hydrolase [Gemmatimonadaceae bacterium]